MANEFAGSLLSSDNQDGERRFEEKTSGAATQETLDPAVVFASTKVETGEAAGGSGQSAEAASRSPSARSTSTCPAGSDSEAESATKQPSSAAAAATGDPSDLLIQMKALNQMSGENDAERETETGPGSDGVDSEPRSLSRSETGRESGKESVKECAKECVEKEKEKKKEKVSAAKDLNQECHLTETQASQRRPTFEEGRGEIETAGKSSEEVFAGATLVADASRGFEECSEWELKMYRMLGLCFAIFIAGLYDLVPIMWLIVFPTLLISTRFSLLSLLAVSAFSFISFHPLPTHKRVGVSLLRSRLYRSVALYFDTKVYAEAGSLDAYNKHPKPILFLLWPHGVISFGGFSYATLVTERMRPLRSASASILLSMPILRQILIAFRMVAGSKHELKRAFKSGEDVCLYSGGLAELFLSDFEEEKLYFNRYGCIKLAMEADADIVLVYLFGNTRQFTVCTNSLLSRISRLCQFSLCLFYGRWYLPIPHHTKSVTVLSKPISVANNDIYKSHANIKSELTVSPMIEVST